MIRVFLMMLACVGIDLMFRFTLADMTISPNLTSLYLMFLGLRKSPKEVFFTLILFFVGIHPFTEVNVISFFLAYWMVLSLMGRLRSKVFAESYLTHSIWIFCFSFFLQTILGVLTQLSLDFTSWGWNFLEIALNSFFAALLTIPCFLLWDGRGPLSHAKTLEFESGWN